MRGLYFTLFILFFIVTHNTKLWGSPPILDTNAIHTAIKHHLNGRDLPHISCCFFNDLITVNDTLFYYLPKGTLHVFEISVKDSVRIKPLRISPYNGHNFNSYTFMYDSVLYNFGGYGFFKFNKKLIRFDWEKGEWFEIQEIKNYPININAVSNTWQEGDSLHVLFELKTADNAFEYGVIQLNKMHYQTIYKFSKTLNFRINHPFYKTVYQGRKFSIIEEWADKTSKYKLLNNSTSEYFGVSFFTDLKGFDGVRSVWINDSILYKRANNGRIDSIHLRDSPIFERVNFIESYKLLHKEENQYFYWLGILLLVVFGSSFFILANKWRKTSSLSNKNLEPEIKDFSLESQMIIKRLLVRMNEQLSQEELDAVFEISDLSYDLRKTRRSILIKQLNDSKLIQINRIRSNQDKRYFVYEITKSK